MPTPVDDLDKVFQICMICAEKKHKRISTWVDLKLLEKLVVAFGKKGLFYRFDQGLFYVFEIGNFATLKAQKM